MATAFVIAALLAHRTLAADPVRRWAAPALFALGLASKENAIVFVALAAALDVLGARRPLEELRARRALYAAYAGVVLAYAVALAPVFWGVFAGPRVLTALSVIPHYVRLLVFPADLSSDYSPRIINLAESVT